LDACRFWTGLNFPKELFFSYSKSKYSISRILAVIWGPYFYQEHSKLEREFFYFLMGQCHEIFDSRFFSSINPIYGRSLIIRLKPFRRWLRIRRENRFESRENRFPRGQ
jgi:hypothetical protein